MSLNYPRSTIKFTHTFFFPSRSNGRLNPINSATSIGSLLPSSFVSQQWTRSQPCTKLYRRASISVFRFRPNPNRPQFQTSLHSPLLRFVLRPDSSPFRWRHFQVDRSTLHHLPPTAFFFSITIRFTCSFNPLVLLSIFFLLYLWYFFVENCWMYRWTRKEGGDIGWGTTSAGQGGGSSRNGSGLRGSVLFLLLK